MLLLEFLKEIRTGLPKTKFCTRYLFNYPLGCLFQKTTKISNNSTGSDFKEVAYQAASETGIQQKNPPLINPKIKVQI